MMDSEQHLLGDSSRWIPASVLLGWSYDMKKLQQFLTSRTFAPHWREFELNWLASGSSDTEKAPPFNTIISKCRESWDSGSNEYYLLKPDRSAWNKDLGLGHHVRLLTMIVRENMASNGIWTIAEGDQLQRYFENAYVVVNSMREEWRHGGKLYEYFRSSNRGQYPQALSRREHNPAISSSNSTTNNQRPSTKGSGQNPRTPSSAPNGHQSSFNSLENMTQAPSTRNDMGPPINSNPSRTATDPLVKKESLVEKETNFLESLEAELAKKKTEMENKISERAAQQAAGNDAISRKRSISGVDDTATKRRKSDELNGSKGLHNPEASASDTGRASRLVSSQQKSASLTGRPLTSSPVDTRRAQATYNEHPGPHQLRDAVNTPSGRYGLAKRPSDPAVHEYRGHSNTTAPTTPSFPRPDNRPYIRSSTVGLTSSDGEGHFRKPIIKQEPHYTGPRESIRGANGHVRVKNNAEDDILETCAYELKGMTCPIRGGCSKKKICIAYSRGEYCRGDCGKSHVLRTCKYKAKFGHCNKEEGRYSAKCTFGHEPIRKEMNDYPGRFHE